YVVRIGEGDRLPLTVGGVPLRIGTLVGSLDVRTREYELTTNLQLPPIGIEKIAPLFCLPRSKLPPAIVTASFPKIELWNGAIEPEGRAWIELFGGTIELKELALYDLTEVPEAGFDLEIEGVKLRDLGDWSGFGEIDGVLTGYARDVVMKSWLPTRFDLLIEPKPLDGSWKLTFSPEAMENTVRLLAEDAVDQMPGIARWFFFGWPAHLVFGYDVKYAGISAYSKDGNILLETLDPMDPRDRNAACGENHFILCGTRFKIPLKSSSYPVLIDNTAMFSFLKKRGEYLLEFAAAKQREREALEAKKAPKKESDADDGSKACLPEVLE
ncbi:MAG TPA: hypothetical protein VM598_10940, partial [Bdellovibrionota bacterium]|nr:hypothetical protein [Bdellovibrionota bacterium]